MIIGASTTVSLACASESFPNRPIELIVPSNPGGDIDKVAKTVAPILSRYLKGVKINIVYKPGNYTGLGLADLVQSPPDGYKIMVGGNFNLVQHLMDENETTKNWDKLMFMRILAIQPLLCATGSSSKIESYKDFSEKLKQAKPKLKYGVTSFYGVIFPVYYFRVSGLSHNAADVVYLNTPAEAFGALANNQVDFICSSIPSLMPYLKDGKVRPIFTNSVRNFVTDRPVPTAYELGLRELSRFQLWTALTIHQKTPPSILKVYKEALTQLSNDPEWLQSEILKYGTNGAKSIEQPNLFVSEQANFIENLFVLSRLLK